MCFDRLYPTADAQLGYFTTHQAEELGVDANWRSGVEELEQTLDRAAVLDLNDEFSFEIGRPR